MCGAICAALLSTAATTAQAARVPPATSVTIDDPLRAPERWNVEERSLLRALNGARLINVLLYGAIFNGDHAYIVSDFGVGVTAYGYSSVSLFDTEVTSQNAAGVVVLGERGIAPGGAGRLEAVRSVISGVDTGAKVGGGSVLILNESTAGAVADDGVGVRLEWGHVAIQKNSVVRGSAAGVLIDASANGDSIVEVSGGHIESADGPAFVVRGGTPGGRESLVTLSKGATVSSQNGPAFHVTDGATLVSHISDSTVRGGVITDKGASARFYLAGGGVLDGRVIGLVDVELGPQALWADAGNSSLRHLGMAGGLMQLGRESALPRTVLVQGDVTGHAGTVELHAHVSPDQMWSDQLIVAGNAEINGSVVLDVRVSGAGAATDVNGDGLPGRAEGLSLVQVAGNSHRDAFVLKGGAIVVGAFQYVLHPFGPDQTTDSTGNGVATTGWDYRLTTRYVDGTGEEPEVPEVPSAGGGTTKPVRPAIAPEMAAYLSTSSAALGYVNALSGGLRQRMGVLRDNEFSGGLGGEIFIRKDSGDQRYKSNRSFVEYGYDFNQSVDATQFGGTIVALDGDNGSWRSGWAYDHGRSTVVPHAVDGRSSTQLRANGISVWSTWKHGSGVWLDAVVGQHRLRGAVSTGMSGSEAGRIKASVGELSLELGVPVSVSSWLAVEPHARVGFQSVSLSSIVGGNDLRVKADRRTYRTYTTGLTLTRRDDRFAPFVRVDVEKTAGGGASYSARSSSASDAATFVAGSPGTTYALAGGVSSQLTSKVQLFAEGSYRHYLNGHGFAGWNGHVGLRVDI